MAVSDIVMKLLSNEEDIKCFGYKSRFTAMSDLQKCSKWLAFHLVSMIFSDKFQEFHLKKLYGETEDWKITSSYWAGPSLYSSSLHSKDIQVNYWGKSGDISFRLFGYR